MILPLAFLHKLFLCSSKHPNIQPMKNMNFYIWNILSSSFLCFNVLQIIIERKFIRYLSKTFQNIEFYIRNLQRQGLITLVFCPLVPPDKPICSPPPSAGRTVSKTPPSRLINNSLNVCHLLSSGPWPGKSKEFNNRGPKIQVKRASKSYSFLSPK